MTNIEAIKALDNAFTKNHTGKMQGMISISTNCTLCESCQKRHNTNNDNCVCKHCYSWRMISRYKTLREKLTRNTELLTSHSFKLDEIPRINNIFARFEAFGEIFDTLQVKNYFTICKANKSVNFALWTKNPHVIEKAMMKYKIKKPRNLMIIYSEPIINRLWTRAMFEALQKQYPFIDKVFTVHNKKSEIYLYHKELINCGDRKCINCGLCYTKNKHWLIYELLK